jgi:hypothetical protein
VNLWVNGAITGRRQNRRVVSPIYKFAEERSWNSLNEMRWSLLARITLFVDGLHHHA